MADTAGLVDRDSEEQLELTDIQGDILVGLQKEAELFVGFVISDTDRFRRFLSGLHVTTARETLVAEDRINAFRANDGKGLLDIRGINIGFTLDGLRKLGVADLDRIEDPAFKAGLAARSASLNDPAEGPGAVANWLVGNGVGEIDGLLIITARGKAEAMATLGDLDMAAGFGTWIPFYTEMGTTRPAPFHGHEHFGYLDGVSQPSVRGRIDAVFPNQKFLHPSRNPGDPNQGLPGSDLHWPGEFLFGYEEQSGTDPAETLGPKNGGLPWMKNGSFMVFRRLEQLVPEFHATARLKAVQQNQSPVEFEARMVGRHLSGCPISLNGGVDDPALGADEMRNNDFEFGPDDPDGSKCPYAAHIRKSYPRNDSTEGRDNDSSEADTQKHRVMRRGIPFGPELGPAETNSKQTHNSRGLMFVCYQTSIEDQFEFILKNWVNNPDFALADAGFDPVLGQATGNRQRFYTGGEHDGRSGHPPRTVLERDFIRPTGGGYFFMPSITAIRTLLGSRPG
jgi:Dyp-type peroxidase family